MTKNLDIEKMALDLAMSGDIAQKKALNAEILDLAYEEGIYPSSIHNFYMARGRSEVSGFTVPAINLRSMTYDLARAIFRVAKKNNSGAFIFEIARSEMEYTDQPPVEYSGEVLAAAIKESFRGPVFIQVDHGKVDAKMFHENPDKEIDSLKTIFAEAMDVGFYNIDIDSSTLVDLSKPDVDEQQLLNYEVCAKLTRFIRQNQLAGIEISIGGEIGEVGGKNSTPEELRAFVRGCQKIFKDQAGASKISVQTGTKHGGVVLPDGTIAQVKLDFETLQTLSKTARDEFGLAGAVQHGASTLPAEAFHNFPETETAEVHLATEFQNMIYESKHFPEDLKVKIYEWLKTNFAKERKMEQTEEQFLYKTRKNALGPFKKDILALPAADKDAIAADIEEKFNFLFKKLNSVNNKQLVDKYTTLKRAT